MATTSSRNLQITFSGDVVVQVIKSASDNLVSPGEQQYLNLTTGNNTITVPTAGSTVPTAVTIIPPSANTVDIILKGVNGDTGIQIHDTDPFVLSLDSAVASFVLNAASGVTGMQLIWS